MASPVSGHNTGNGIDQLKAQIQTWIRQEIGNAMRGGVGLSVNGETGDLIFNERGALVVDDADGTEIAVIGNLGSRVALKSDGSQQKGWVLRRDSGELAGFCDTNVVGGLQSWNWTDRNAHSIVADDAVSGDALATPYIPLGGFIPASSATWQGTTSATFTDLYLVQTVRQHPKVTVAGYAYAPTGTNGSVQITVNGTAAGSPVAITGNGTVIYWQIGPVVASSGWQTSLDVRLQAKVTAGTGTFSAIPTLALGVQS